MIESDRCRLLVVDACDTMSRMSDRVMADSAQGISDHIEELLLGMEDKRVEDLCASSIMVALAILKPVSETLLASSSGRFARSRESAEIEIEFPKSS
jgi:hypothetical protein